MKGPGGGKTDEISLPLALNFSGEADPVDNFFLLALFLYPICSLIQTVNSKRLMHLKLASVLHTFYVVD